MTRVGDFFVLDELLGMASYGALEPAAPPRRRSRGWTCQQWTDALPSTPSAFPR